MTHMIYDNTTSFWYYIITSEQNICIPQFLISRKIGNKVKRKAFLRFYRRQNSCLAFFQ